MFTTKDNPAARSIAVSLGDPPKNQMSADERLYNRLTTAAHRLVRRADVHRAERRVRAEGDRLRC
jgi:hypothetical protein